MIPITRTATFPFFDVCPSLCRFLILRAFARMPRGHLRIILPDGARRTFGDGQGPAAVINVNAERFFHRCVFSGDIGFAESYLDGDWDSPDVTAVIRWFILNHEEAPTLSGSRNQKSFNLLSLANRLRHLLRPNSRRISRRNISDHYDLSNDFFALMLDPSMMYSSARWPSPELSLTEAQREKNESLCRKLRLRPEDHVLEIGTGWGGWSLHAAQHHGCRVTTVTISAQQHEFARRRIAAAGLSDRVDVQLRDYRELKGRFDKIVSIEMMEAIGHQYLPEYCAVLDQVLAPDGLVALQFITCPDHRYDELRRGVDFIQKHIFPGSLLLSLGRVNSCLAEAGGFEVREVDDFGTDYARTLRLWQDNFQARLEEVRALGFDQRFIRKWGYYLSYCEAAFAQRHISVVQTLHARAG
jgi:cyclopropane-fatty-acyl-phospholipid synthase